MSRFIGRVWQFFHEEEGPTAVEYALILSAIIAVCLLGIQSVGVVARNSLNNSANQISKQMGS